MSFMDNNFMLVNEPAKKLYDQVKDLPIHDFHCHLEPQEIYEDKPYEDIVDLWLGGDHYKWRLMRANGVSEDLITGDAPKKDKFKAWATAIGKAFGNPLFHFTHLEMKMYFGIEEHLNADNWEEMYNRLNAHIQETKMSPRKLIKDSGVYFIGTTDAPLDDLEWHKKIAAEEDIEAIVAPTFRPDAAFAHHVDFAQFVKDLSALTGVEITGFDSMVEAMEARIKYFADNGCKASDISFDGAFYEPATAEELQAIFDKAAAGQGVNHEEMMKWQTEMFNELCGLYKKYGLVTQVHFGARRNNNTKYFERVGGDAGFDSIGDQVDMARGVDLTLDRLVQEDKLPKMIWYNLNPAYNTVLANNLANFQANEDGIKSQVQFGAAWWFADNKRGMINQMTTLGEESLLANFVGMLTDSRSFLSYARHDYFRRILASLLGQWVADGEIPEDYDFVGQIAQDISFNNAKDFFS